MAAESEGNRKDRTNLDEYKWKDFFEEFQSESPRAAVIISCAFLDSLLRDLIGSFLVEDAKKVTSCGL